MTNEEKQEIVNEVLAALQTHGKTIDQLTPVTSPSDSDAFELSGGRNLSYGKLKELITAIFTAALTGYVPADSLWDYIQQYIAKLGTNGALDWQESPVVMLATMGTSFDNVDGELPAYTLQEGDMYYQYGVNYQIFRKLAQGSEGMPAKADVVYFNMRTWRTYKWTGSTMVEIAKPKNRVVLADLHTQDYNSMATGTIAYNPIAKKIVEKVTSTSWSVSDPDPDYIYCDAQTNTSLRWDATNSAWVQVGGGSGGSVLKNVTFEDGNLIFTFETEQGEQVITVPIEFDASNYVPITRTVNGKALSQDITIGQSDISGLTAALAALVPQTRTINGKALSSNVTIGMSDIQGLVDAINNAGSGAVSVTTNQDGTFTIHVGSTDYTINLNHTHENMAKLIVCEESDLPSTLDNSTIYVITDSGETEIEKLIIRGMEFAGGGVPDTGEPMISSPSNGSTINLGENEGSGVSKTITIKGKNLTGDLTAAVSTGLTISYGQALDARSVTIPMAQALLGVQVTIAYAGSGTLANGSLVISHGGSVLSSVVVEVAEPAPATLAAVKFTGTQWLQTDYVPNPNTEFDLDCKLEVNANTDVRKSFEDGYCAYLLHSASYNGNIFFFSTTGDEGSSYNIMCKNNVSADNVGTQRLVFEQNTAAMLQRGTLKYEKYNGAMRMSFNNVSVNLGLKSGSQNSGLAICRHVTQNVTMNRWNLYIYEFTIKENGSIVKHWVPHMKNGIAGLLDTVSGAFISSETSTELEAVTQSNS